MTFSQSELSLTCQQVYDAIKPILGKTLRGRVMGAVSAVALANKTGKTVPCVACSGGGRGGINNAQCLMCAGTGLYQVG